MGASKPTMSASREILGSPAFPLLTQGAPVLSFSAPQRLENAPLVLAEVAKSREARRRPAPRHGPAPRTVTC